MVSANETLRLPGFTTLASPWLWWWPIRWKSHLRFINNLANYYLLVQADVPRLEGHFLLSEDTLVNPLGSKAVGELGIIGVAGAICNAVYPAPGRRLCELPSTSEKRLGF